MKAMKENPQLVYHIYSAISKEQLKQFAFSTVQMSFCKMAKRCTDGIKVSEHFIKNLANVYCCYFLGFMCRFLWDEMKPEVDESVDLFIKIWAKFTEYMLTNGQSLFEINAETKDFL